MSAQMLCLLQLLFACVAYAQPREWPTSPFMQPWNSLRPPTTDEINDALRSQAVELLPPDQVDWSKVDRRAERGERGKEKD